MSTYTAPLKDMQFAITELAGLAEVAALPGYAEVNAELVDAVLGEAAKFAQEVLDPAEPRGRQAGRAARRRQGHRARGLQGGLPQVHRGRAGTASAAQPEYGGQGLPHLVATPVQEIWKSANMAFCLCPDADLRRAGSAEGPRLARAEGDLRAASSPRASGPAP